MTLTLTPPPDSAVERSDPSRDDRAARLAELVVHLTDCEPAGALQAIDRQELSPTATVDAALGAVAQAMVSVRRP